jgi:hypothetical protein
MKSITKPKTDPKPVRRGGDELPFMDSRAGSTPLDAPTIRAHVDDLAQRVVGASRARGREAHEVGTILDTLYMRHADAVLGYKSFPAFLEDRWPDSLDEAYGAMHIARACTATQAETHGFWKAFYGIRLMKKLGLPSFAALEKHVFDADRYGAKSFAAMKVATVQRFTTQPSLVVAPPTEKVGREVVRLRDRAEALREKRSEYAALKVRVFAAEGKPCVTITAAGRDGSETARRFLGDLWK